MREKQQSGSDALRDFVEGQEKASEAFEKLVGLYGAMVYQTCLRVLRDHGMAEDAAQSTFCVFARKAATVHGDPGAFLHRVALDASRMALRAQKTRKAYEAKAARLATLKDDGVATQNAEWSEVRTHLDAAIERLPTLQRRAVMLHYLQGRTRPETAEALGIAEGTVSSHLNRALEKLRRSLRRYGSMMPAAAFAQQLAACGSASDCPAHLLSASKDLWLSSASQLEVANLSQHVALITKGILKIMFWQKVKLASTAAIAALIIVAAVPLTYHVTRAEEAPLVASTSGSTKPLPTSTVIKSESMNWKAPTDRPAFRELLTGEVFKTRFQKALQGIDVARLSRSKRPVFGLEVARLDEGSPFDKGGLRLGDILLTVNGTRVQNFSHLYSLTANGQFKVLVYQTPSGKKRTIKIGAQGEDKGSNEVSLIEAFDISDGWKLGLSVYPKWRPEFIYLRKRRGTKRDPKWEKWVLVAATHVTTDPNLAETALFHAVKAGFPKGYLTDVLGSKMASRQSRLDECLSYGWFALQEHPGSAVVSGMMVDAAYRTHRLALAREILVQAGNAETLVFENNQNVLVQIDEGIKKYEGLTPKEREEPAPGKVAKRYGTRNLLPFLALANGKAGDSSWRTLQMLKTGSRSRLRGRSRRPGAPSVTRLVMTPAQDAIDYSVRFQLAGKPMAEDTKTRGFMIGLADAKHGAAIQDAEVAIWADAVRAGNPPRKFNFYRYYSGVALGLAMRSGPDGLMYSMYNEEGPVFSSRLMRFTPEMEDLGTVHEVRFLAARGRCEVLLDGQRIFEGPIKRNTKFMPYLGRRECILRSLKIDVRSINTSQQQALKAGNVGPPMKGYAVVVVRLRDAAGQPIKGQRLHFKSVFYFKDGLKRSLSVSASPSSEDGTIRVACKIPGQLPKKDIRWFLQVSGNSDTLFPDINQIQLKPDAITEQIVTMVSRSTMKLKVPFHGVVVDEKGAPHANAEVFVVARSHAKTREDFEFITGLKRKNKHTNKRGEFMFEALPDGEYMVLAKARFSRETLLLKKEDKALESEIIPITVRAGRPVEKRLVMKVIPRSKMWKFDLFKKRAKRSKKGR